MKGTQIEILGLKFVAGLWWHPVDRNGKQRVLAQELATEDAKFNAMIALSTPPQVGVTSAQLRRRRTRKLPKVFSLACTLKQALEEQSPEKPVSALVRMPLPGKSLEWCFCVVDGVIVPDGDFVGTPSEVDSFFELNQRETSDWFYTRVIEAEEEALDELKDLVAGLDLKKSPSLRLINQPTYALYAAIAAILFLVCGYFGYSAYTDWRDAQELARLQAQMRQKKAKPAVTSSPDVQTLFPPVWNNYPAPEKLLNTCYGAASTQVLFVDGWSLSKIACAGSSLEITYTITKHGSYLSLPSGALQRPDRAKMQKSFNTLKLKGISKRTAELNLGSISKIVGSLYETAKAYKTAISVNLAKRGAKTIKGPDGPETVLAPYREGQFTFTGGLAPELMQSGALALPGIIVSSITYDVSSQTWKIGGKYYASLQ